MLRKRAFLLWRNYVGIFGPKWSLWGYLIGVRVLLVLREEGGIGRTGVGEWEGVEFGFGWLFVGVDWLASQGHVSTLWFEANTNKQPTPLFLQMSPLQSILCLCKVS